jgi:hypothetical protein
MSCSVAISSSAYRHGGATNLERPVRVMAQLAASHVRWPRMAECPCSQGWREGTCAQPLVRRHLSSLSLWLLILKLLAVLSKISLALWVGEDV